MNRRIPSIAAALVLAMDVGAQAIPPEWMSDSLAHHGRSIGQHSSDLHAFRAGMEAAGAVPEEWLTASARGLRDVADDVDDLAVLARVYRAVATSCPAASAEAGRAWEHKLSRMRLRVSMDAALLSGRRDEPGVSASLRLRRRLATMRVAALSRLLDRAAQ